MDNAASCHSELIDKPFFKLSKKDIKFWINDHSSNEAEDITKLSTNQGYLVVRIPPYHY